MQAPRHLHAQAQRRLASTPPLRAGALHSRATWHKQLPTCTSATSQHAAEQQQQQQQQQQDATPARQQEGDLAAQQRAAEASARQLLTRRSHAPPRFVGPIQVSRVPGKRFGLTATRNLVLGELLLVSTPLVVGFGPAGDPPGNALLVEQLQQLQGATQLHPWQLQWLRALHRSGDKGGGGSGAGGAAEGVNDSAAAADKPDQQQQQQQPGPDGKPAAASSQEEELLLLLPLLQQLLARGPDAAPDGCDVTPSPPPPSPPGALAAAPPLSPPPPAATTTAAAAAAAGGLACVVSAASSQSQQQPGHLLLTQQQLQDVVAENAYAEDAEDLGAALLRELAPEGVAGLWPEFALLNHSCAPNTQALCVGRYLLLRVTCPVLAGEELTANYLGAGGLAPVAPRRAALRGRYGFHCTCARCCAEQRTFPTQRYAEDGVGGGLGLPSAGAAAAAAAADVGRDAGGSSSSSGGGGFLDAVGRLLGLSQQGSGGGGGSSAPAPRPSRQQHALLLQQFDAARQQLGPAAQDAAAADSRRAPRQLALLADVSTRVDAVAVAAAAAAAADPLLRDRVPRVTQWLLGGVYPLLELQVTLCEMLLASGEVPLDHTQRILDEGLSSGFGGGSSDDGSGSNKALATAGAAAAARLSLSRRGRNGSSSSSSMRAQRRAAQGLPGWLSGLWSAVGGPGGGGTESDVITKRDLLGLYIEALGRCLGVLDAVGRGSEAHVALSIKHMDAVRRLAGVDAPDTALAETACGRAHAVRYGVLAGREGQALLAALISARRRQLLGRSLAHKMSVLAWESSGGVMTSGDRVR